METPREVVVARRQARLLRWVDAILLALLAAGIAITLGHKLTCASQTLMGVLGWTSFNLLAAFGLLLLLRLLGQELRKSLIVSSLIVYPPTWWVALLASTLLALVWRAEPRLLSEACLPEVGISVSTGQLSPTQVRGTVNASDSPATPISADGARAEPEPNHLVPRSDSIGIDVLWLLGIHGLLLGGSFICRRRRLRRSQESQSAHRVQATTSSTPSVAAGLEPWGASDKPIKSAREDRFDHQVIAQQMSAQLRADRDLFALGLIGPLGSGKSSVANLVAEDLRLNGSSIQIIQLSIWAYETVDAAMAAIIRSLTRTLEEASGARTLSAVADEYLGLVADDSGIVRLLSRVLSPRTPQLALEKIDQVALALDKQLVLWIDDIERFSGSSNTNGEENTSRMAPLRALLADLGGQQSIRVVLATHDVSSLPDFDRVVQMSYLLPPLDARHIAQQLVDLRSELLRGSKVLPAHPEDIGVSRWQLGNGGQIETIPFAVAGMFTTPRKLKYFTRTIRQSWGVLQGEVDLDDLFLMTAVKCCHEAAFAAILELRPSPRESLDKTQANEQAEHVERVLSTVLKDSPLRKSVLAAFDYVWPGIRHRYGSEGFARQPAQGFRHNYASYLSRMALQRPFLAGEVPDQPFIQAISDFAEGRPDQLAQWFLDGRHWPASAVNLTRVRLTLAQRLSLLRAVCTIARSSNIRSIALLEAAVRRVWLLFEPAEVVSLDTRASLEQVVATSGEWNLSLAVTLVRFFSLRLDPRNQGQNENAPQLQVALKQAFLESSRKPTSDFLLALDGDYEQLIRDAFFRTSTHSADTAGPADLPFSDWPAVASALIGAFKQAPAQLAPKILYTIIRESGVVTDDGGMLNSDAFVDYERAEALWPELVDELARFDDSAYDPASLRGRMSKIIKEVRRENLDREAGQAASTASEPG